MPLPAYCSVEELQRAVQRALTSPGAILGGLIGTGYVAEWACVPTLGHFAVGRPLAVVIADGGEHGEAGGGRWWRREIPADTWVRADLRYPLTLCLEGCVSTELADGSMPAGHAVSIVFDPAVADRLGENGINARWTSVTGRAVIDGFGTLNEITVTLGDGAEVSELTWALRWYEAPLTIALPDPARLITRAAYDAELEEESYR